MPTNPFREPMQNLSVTHKEFKKIWAEHHRAKGKNKETLETEVNKLRTRFRDAFDFLFQTKLEPLRKAFLTNRVNNVDDVIDFLAVDIPAFRCGYEKEWYISQLKSLTLNEAQKERLRAIAFELCKSPDFRREFSDWSRLMIVLANKVFVEELENLRKSDNEFIQKKSEKMLNTIVENRKDLKTQTII